MIDGLIITKSNLNNFPARLNPWPCRRGAMQFEEQFLVREHLYNRPPFISYAIPYFPSRWRCLFCRSRPLVNHCAAQALAQQDTRHYRGRRDIFNIFLQLSTIVLSFESRNRTGKKSKTEIIKEPMCDDCKPKSVTSNMNSWADCLNVTCTYGNSKLFVKATF